MTPALHVHEFGPPGGFPLLALHGVCGHGARWRGLATSRLDGFRVLAPDLRGHGRSTPLPPWTLEQHAADLLAMIDGYGLDAVPVLAHSFGAAIALHLQRLAPGRVTRLVLLDPAIGLDPKLALDLAGIGQRVFTDQRQAWEAQRYDWPAVPDEIIAEELAEHLERIGDRWVFRYRQPAVATAWSEMSRAPVLPNPGTPTLVIRALREQYTSPAFLNGCQLALDSEFELIDLDCGHMVYLERPDETADAIIRFVS